MTHSTTTTLKRCGAPRRSHKLLALIGAALMAGAPVASAYAQDAGGAPKPPAAGPAGNGPGVGGPEGRGPGGDRARMADRDGGSGDWRGGHQRGDRHMRGRGAGRMMMRHMAMMRMMTPAKLAGALSALETGMGITPDQMAVWRRFSGALVAFAAASRPSGIGHGMGPGRRHGMMMGDGSSADAGDQADSRDQAEDQAADTNAEAVDPMDQQDEADDSSDDDAGDQADAADRAQPDARAFRFLDRIADRAIARGEAAQTLKAAVEELKTTLTLQQIAAGRDIVRSMMREARQDFRQERRDWMERRMERHEMRHGGMHGHHGHYGEHGGRGGWRGDHHRGGPDRGEQGRGGPDGQGSDQGPDQGGDDGSNPDNG